MAARRAAAETDTGGHQVERADIGTFAAEQGQAEGAGLIGRIPECRHQAGGNQCGSQEVQQEKTVGFEACHEQTGDEDKPHKEYESPYRLFDAGME